MGRNHFIAMLATLVLLGAAFACAQIQIWPLRLRAPDGSDLWWFLVMFFPLIVFPLNAIPRLAVPLVLAMGGIGIVIAAVCWQPDLQSLCITTGLLVALALLIEPRIIALVRRVIARLRRYRNRPDPQEPPEFSPALVPRGPRKPSPLVARARITAGDAK